MRPAPFAAFLFAAACAAPAHAAAFDAAFAAGGMAQDYLDLGATKADFFADAAIAPTTGALYSVGRAETVSAGSATTGVLFKRLANGAKDTAFTNGSSGTSRVLLGPERGGASSALAAVAFDASNTGAVLVAGFNDLNNGKRCGVVYKVLDNTVMQGALDGGFGTSGRFSWCAGTSSAIAFSDIKVLPDGRTLVSGNGTLPSGERYGFLLRLTVAGQLDTTFNAIGAYGSTPGTLNIDIRPGKDDSALRIAVGAQGYYVGGNATYLHRTDPLFGDDVDLWVARVTTAGAFDTSFNGNGKRVEAIDLPNSDMTDLLADLALDASGRVLLLANVNPAQLTYDAQANQDPNRYNKSAAYVIRLTGTGARDTSLLGTGMKSLSNGSGGCGHDFCDYEEPAALATLPNNGIVVTGRWVPGGQLGVAPPSQLSILTTSSDGTTGTGQRFSDWPRSEGVSLLRQPDGKLVVGGLVRTVGTVSDVDFALWRFQAQ